MNLYQVLSIIVGAKEFILGLYFFPLVAFPFLNKQFPLHTGWLDFLQL